MENEDLFCSDKLERLFNRIKKNISEDIHYYNVHKQLNGKEAEITEKVFMRYKINAPYLNEEDMYQINDENAPIPISEIKDKLKLKNGEHCTFVVPFSGDFELFYLQPASDNIEKCHGIVTKDKLMVSYELSDGAGTGNILNNFKNNITAARNMLNCIHQEADAFNSRLHEFIKEEIKRAKESNASESSFLSVA